MSLLHVWHFSHSPQIIGHEYTWNGQRPQELRDGCIVPCYFFTYVLIQCMHPALFNSCFLPVACLQRSQSYSCVIFPISKNPAKAGSLFIWRASQEQLKNNCNNSTLQTHVFHIKGVTGTPQISCSWLFFGVSRHTEIPLWDLALPQKDFWVSHGNEPRSHFPFWFLVCLFGFAHGSRQGTTNFALFNSHFKVNSAQ